MKQTRSSEQILNLEFHIITLKRFRGNWRRTNCFKILGSHCILFHPQLQMLRGTNVFCLPVHCASYHFQLIQQEWIKVWKSSEELSPCHSVEEKKNLQCKTACKSQNCTRPSAHLNNMDNFILLCSPLLMVSIYSQCCCQACSHRGAEGTAGLQECMPPLRELPLPYPSSAPSIHPPPKKNVSQLWWGLHSSLLLGSFEGGCWPASARCNPHQSWKLGGWVMPADRWEAIMCNLHWRPGAGWGHYCPSPPVQLSRWTAVAPGLGPVALQLAFCEATRPRQGGQRQECVTSFTPCPIHVPPWGISGYRVGYCWKGGTFQDLRVNTHLHRGIWQRELWHLKEYTPKICIGL